VFLGRDMGHARDYSEEVAGVIDEEVRGFIESAHQEAYETLVDPKVATVLAQETGATTAVLDPVEGVAEGSEATYVTLMDANLAAVTAGQPCS
jgi:cell division protease FtsH